MHDYIALEKMRFHDTLNISFTTHNIPEDLKIAPMLLLPFVENSFKHGVIKKGKLDVIMDIKCENKTLCFYIENTHSPVNTPQKGIGLENIQKRLDLVYYNQYTLAIDDEHDTFKVALTLNLKR